MQTTKRPSARILALLLTVAMLCSLLPMSVFAADGASLAHNLSSGPLQLPENGCTCSAENQHMVTGTLSTDSVGIQVAGTHHVTFTDVSLSAPSNRAITVGYGGELRLTLVGTNSLSASDRAVKLSGAAKLNILGAGNLTVTSNNSYAIGYESSGSPGVSPSLLVNLSDNGYLIATAGASSHDSAITSIINFTITGMQMKYNTGSEYDGPTHVTTGSIYQGEAGASNPPEAKDVKITKDTQGTRTTTLDLTTISNSNTMGAAFANNVYTHALEKWSYDVSDASNPVLTLNGVDFNVASGHAINIPAQNLTINVEGTNSIKSLDANTNAMKAGISINTPSGASGTLTIQKAGTDNASLNVEGFSGISLSNVAVGVVVDGVDVTLTGSGVYKNPAVFGFYGPSFELKNGTLRATASDKAIHCSTQLTIPPNAIILGSSDKNASDGSLTAAQLSSDGKSIVMSDGSTVAKTVKITSPTIVVGGDDATDGYGTADATTLQKAFDDISDGGIVKLGTNIDTKTTTITHSANKAVTLDLNGKEWTSEPDEATLQLSNAASLTVKDSGTGGKLTNIFSKAITQGGTGTLTIAGGTVHGQDYAIYNGTGNASSVSGILTISGGTLTSQLYNVISNQVGGGDITISGGTVEAKGSGSAIANSSPSKITISGTAVVTSKNATLGWDTISILSKPPSSPKILLDIQGGTVSNTAKPVGNAIHFNDLGYSSENLSDYYSHTGGTVIGKITPTPLAASIGNTKYETLEEAFAAISTMPETDIEIKIGSNLTLTNGVELTASTAKNVTLDLNGKTVSITGSAEDDQKPTALTLEKVALTITDSAATKGSLRLTGVDSDKAVNASGNNLTISGAYVTVTTGPAAYYGIVASTLRITEDGSLSTTISAKNASNVYALELESFVMDSGTVTVNINGKKTIGIMTDDIDITGGMLTVTAGDQALRAKNPPTISSDLFARCNTATGSAPATYRGQTYNGVIEIAGNFYHTIYQGETGSETIVKDLRIASPAASIGNTKYATLEEALDAALDAATNDQTVTIESNLTLTNGIDLSADDWKHVILDLNGKTVSMTGSTVDGGNSTVLNLFKIALTITDSAATKGFLTLTGANTSSAIYSNSDVTISKAHVKATGNSGTNGSILIEGTLKITELAELEARLSTSNASVIYAANFIMDSGKATILGSNSGSMGISTEGDITITGGTLTVTMATSPLAALLAGGTITLTNVVAKYNTAASGTATYTGETHVGTYTVTEETVCETIYQGATGTTTIATDVQIGAPSADKTALSAAITNAKTIMANTVISVSNGSDVSTSTYWVLPAIMSAAKDALKEAEDMLANATATQGEIANATTTLNAKVNIDFKNAKKLGTKSSNGGSGGSGNSGSTTTPSKPTEAVKGESNTTATVDNGKANANISEKNVSDAVQAAKDEAAKKGVTAGEVTAVINVKTGSDDVNTVSVNLPKSVQEQVINGKIGNLAIVIDKPDISIGMNLATITEMNKQAKADIQLSATRMDASKLSDEAKTVIGNRPAFDLKASYENGSKSVTNFGNGTVSIAIPYTLQSGEVADGVYGVYVDDNGKANTISGSKYDASAKVLRFNTNHFSVYGIGYQAPAQTGFVDVAGHWAKSDIDFVVGRGLMNGTSDTTFSPNGSMTRGMFVTVLGRLAKVDTNAYQTSKFTDVSTSMYYAPYVNWAAEKGITKGTGTNTFSPEQAISRQEMAVFMNSFAKVQGYTIKSTNEAIQFADNASIANWASEAVKTMQMAGILNGKDGNKFDPLGTATRAEISSMLHRFVQTVVE